MAHKPVGSGVSFAVATASATSGIITHFTDTVRVHALGGDAHVVVGLDPTALNSELRKQQQHIFNRVARS